MSVGIVFHFEDNIASIQSGRDVDMRMWANIAKSFDMDFYYCIDCTEAGIRHEDSGYIQYKSLRDCKEDNPDIKWIYLVPASSLSDEDSCEFLHEYSHPSDNIGYVFGRDSSGIGKEDMKDGKILSINASSRSMWAHIAAGIVLHDRKNRKVDF